MALRFLSRWSSKQSQPDSLDDILGVEPFLANPYLPPITWAHHKPGVVVEVVAGLAALVGLSGIVKKIWECGGVGEVHPDNDLYIIEVSQARNIAVEYRHLRRG